MSYLDKAIILVFSLLLIAILVIHFEFKAYIQSAFAKIITNGTFLENPDDETLVNAYSNGGYLSYYSTPKANDLKIREGNWDMEKLSKVYPDIIDKRIQNSREVFFIKKSLVIEKDAELNVLNSKVLLKSLSKKDNIPSVIITYGKTNIINSTIISWDPEYNRADVNPYHPRSFLVAKNGGIMNVVESTISYLGFSEGGIFTLFSSLAGLNYYNSTGFVIVNSTIANNLYGFYSDQSSNFKILDNQIYDNVGYGLDPHTNSKDFVIASNHVFTNGGEGIICSFRCKNVTISNNTVQYNMEGIGLHWLTNSSKVENNIIKYNKRYGIYISNNSYNNIIEDNTILGNGHGIGLLGHSNDNIIKFNTVRGNILSRDQIFEDDISSNFIKHNYE